MTTGGSAAPIRRHIVEIDGRHVHMRVKGRGPAVVLLHGSPGSSLMQEELMRALPDTLALFALDTPGFGQSDPLPGDGLTLSALADAVVAVMGRLGAPSFTLFGTHTGAAIALEAARRHAGVVARAVLDGAPCFNADEQAMLLSDTYMPAFSPDVLGGHFAQTWTRFRDQHIWFPWFSKTPETLIDADLAAPAAINLWVEMFFDAARHYRPAYRAAIAYGDGAIDAVRSLSRPAVFMAEAHDMLFPHLERLPLVEGGHRCVRLAPGADRNRVVADLLADAAGAWTDTARLPSGRAQRGYTDVAGGQLYWRRGTADGDPGEVWLHDLPGGGERLLTTHGDDMAFGVAPDLPGCGFSKVDWDGGQDELADLLIAFAAAHGVSQFKGVGLGRLIARRVAQRAHGRPVDGEGDEGGASSRDWALETASAIEADGAHWYQTWQLLRDSLIYAPATDRRVGALRRAPASFNAAELHDWTREVLRQPEGHRKIINGLKASQP